MSEVITAAIAAIATIVGFAIGYIIGYIIAKKRSTATNKNTDVTLLNNLNNQILEIKTKLEETEKLRRELTEQRDKQIREIIEQRDKNLKESEEKRDKQIKEMLEERDKSIKEQENKRDEELKEAMKQFISITRVISGTKTRGNLGENILKQALSNAIQSGLITTNLKTVNGEVEFAWDLKDGKYIPIDSKMPDVFEALKQYNNEKNTEEQKKLKRDIINKVKKHISEVEKYKNLQNTIDKCILVVPESIIELYPELITLGEENNIFITSYKNAFTIAYLLSEQYYQLKENKDIGEYKQILEKIYSIVKSIAQKTETIDRVIVQLRNANESIKTEIQKINREKYKSQQQ